MKLQCDVEVINRMLPSCGLKSKGRSSRAVLSIGRPERERAAPSTGSNGSTSTGSSGSGLHLLICTSRDRSGAKYKLKENVEKFFTWFVEEGKATVRLKEPAIDICLSKADVTSLKSFLSAVRLAQRGAAAAGGVPLSALCPVRAREVEKPKQKLTVLSRRDYPLTRSFPPALQQLQVSYCQLNRVDLRVLSLRALRRLDLSNNRIRALPAGLGDLRALAELVLHNNQLERFGDELCCSGLQTSLRLLDLSHNLLPALPARFCQLRQLVTLRLDHNRLQRLPFHLGRLSALRFLSAAHNQLPVLPDGFRSLRLDTLDLFGNPFARAHTLQPRMLITLPLTLQELAARTVLDHRVPHSPQLLPLHLCRELDFSSVCVCGRMCVNAFIQTAVSFNLHQVAHTVVLVDNMGGTEAPVHTHFCSLLCYCQHMDECVQRELR
uniref:leucine-rich repeat protein 1 isoform 1 n=1 Tax=Danio rerio TaxID=7955 RepID=UPI003F4EF9CF